MQNIKYYLIATLFILITANHTKANIDSLTFEQQRATVNSLLDDRANRFGQYISSLEERTGFFGLIKSKNDMQKSINILQDIVQTDNKIFIETRKLLQIKDNEAEKYQRLASKYDEQVTAYMKTISKLQATNEKLRLEIEVLEDGDNNNKNISFVLGFLLLVLGIILFRLYRRKNPKKLT
ncbi:hypothetical protein [Sphingobacterium rhinopitheci]|uniref:hypothetical protein n=1 Tax=Sphingobacterium rhinopitheci TaxID=2781960 RepID=UPI001F51F9CB|nr:hypothetical protein [Sphingobacterium rhinopitheci]MCI0920828.1 hypothetical protein [Sphingobacterium rhinopitheci]